MIMAILQARFSSTRFPGKVLKPILGKPMLLLQIERVRRVQGIDRFVLATSTHPSDDEVARICREAGLTVFRGSLDDVLDRLFQAAQRARPDHVVRLTGDCPLTDADLIDRAIDFHVRGNFDYSSNTIEPTWPDGLDVEVVRFFCLEQAWREAILPSEREHVTSFIYTRPERFRIGNLKNNVDLSALRWTVDEPADFELVRTIYEALYPVNPAFGTSDILALLEKRPQLEMINKGFQRNAGYMKSLYEDASFLKKKG